MTISMLYAHTTDSAYSKKIGHIIDCRRLAIAGAYLISAWMPPLAQRRRCLYRPRKVSGIRIHDSARGS